MLSLQDNSFGGVSLLQERGEKSVKIHTFLSTELSGEIQATLFSCERAGVLITLKKHKNV